MDNEMRRGEVEGRKTAKLSMLLNVFLKIANCICLDHNIYLLKGDGQRQLEVRRGEVGGRDTADPSGGSLSACSEH